MPQPQKKQQRLSLSFLYAAYGEQVVQQLSKEDERSYLEVFSELAIRDIKRYRDGTLFSVNFDGTEKCIAHNVSAVMQDFYGQAFPQAQQKPQIAQWVVKQYLSHRHNGKPILAEDLYKIKENIEYFDSLKKSRAFKVTGSSPDLLSYKTYADFEAMLKPFEQRRIERDGRADMLFGLKPEQKKEILAETTILYEGTDGRVVVPHTPEASKFWGSHTKWCIAGRDYAESYFPRYNAESPVIMILPKGHENDKIALVDKTLYNSADNTIPVLPELHRNLMQNCLDGLSAGARQNIAPWVPEAIFEMEKEKSVQKKRTLRLGGYDFVDEEIDDIVEEEANLAAKGYDIDPDFWSNRELVLAAVKKYGFLLKYAPAFNSDHEIVLAAVEENSSALEYAEPELRADRDFMFTAIRRNANAMRYMAPELQADRKFLLPIVNKDGWTYRILPKELQSDPEFVLAAVTQSGDILSVIGAGFQADIKIVFAAVEHDGLALRHVKGLWNSYPGLVRTAVKQNAQALVHAADSLKQDSRFVSSLLKESEELPFQIGAMKSRNLWQPDEKTLFLYQQRALEQMAARGDMEKFTKYIRHMKSTWGNPDILFAANPAATLAKIKAATQANDNAKPKFPAARMAI